MPNEKEEIEKARIRLQAMDNIAGMNPGWQVQNTWNKPNIVWSYTIGLHENFTHPEILVIGLPSETAHIILNGIGTEVKSGKRFEANKRYDGILRSYDATFVPVAERLGREWAIRAYSRAALKDQVPVIYQLVWPDSNNKFPWEEGFDNQFLYQPVLSS